MELSMTCFFLFQGKPRGRSRSGGKHAPTHQQQLVNNANSNTLLSHLLAGSNSLSNNVSALAPATAGGGVGDYGIGSAPLNMIMGQSDINSASTSYQPSPFHIPPPNTPLVVSTSLYNIYTLFSPIVRALSLNCLLVYR
jgi:hypothetical protein